MYKNLFNPIKQDEMRNFFLNTLAPLGTKKSYKKNETVTIPSFPTVCIITDGKVKVSLYSSKGSEKLLYFLIPGEIFGEMHYFNGGDLNIIVKSLSCCTVSFVSKETIDEIIKENPYVYRFFIHSITRKYRISLCQTSDILFSSSTSRVANTLFRLAILSGENVNDNHIINLPLTHQELANLVGCSRITITRVLNSFKDEGIIEMKNKTLTIFNMNALRNHIHKED